MSPTNKQNKHISKTTDTFVAIYLHQFKGKLGYITTKATCDTSSPY